MIRTDTILAFYSKYDWPSNFYPCQYTLDDKVFNCGEQGYMYRKAKFFEDYTAINRIMKQTDPGFIKWLGRSVRNYSDEAWFPVRDDHMRDVLIAKYTTNKKMGNLLLETNDLILLEASLKDKYWGAGISQHGSEIHQAEFKFPGENRLGYLTMEVREYIAKANELF